MNLREYFNTIMDLSHGIVVSLNRDGRIVHANDRLARLLHCSVEELVGRDWGEACFSESERRVAKAILSECLRTTSTTRAESRIPAPDGRKLYIDWKLRPLLDSRGEFSVVICVGQDVTAHMTTAKDLFRERMSLVGRNKVLACLYAISQYVSDLDRDLEDVLCDIVKVIPDAFQFPEHTCARLRLGDIVCEAGAPVDSEHRLSHPIELRGKTRGTLDVAYDGAFTTPSPGEEFSPGDVFLEEERQLLVAACRQLSLLLAKKEAQATRLQLERQLRHADRLAKIGQFASGVAHELNEPLANILGFAQLAGKADDLPEQVSKDLESIVKSSLRAREVIRKLMYFSRQVPPQMVSVNLNDIVRDALHFTEPSANRNNVVVVCDLADDLPDVTADPQHMRQVVVNLAVNAIQAMKDGGTLTFETKASEDDVYLIVSDTGEGIAPDVLKQIFNPFFTTKDLNEGTGLGLSVVHGILKSHGGYIEAASTVGAGTRFEVAIPCTECGDRAQ